MEYRRYGKKKCINHEYFSISYYVLLMMTSVWIQEILNSWIEIEFVI